MKRTPNWDNYIMRKYGQSIRAEIASAYGVFWKAVMLTRLLKAAEEMEMEALPEDVWRAA
jgi:hypothetical protein